MNWSWFLLYFWLQGSNQLITQIAHKMSKWLFSIVHQMHFVHLTIPYWKNILFQASHFHWHVLPLNLVRFANTEFLLIKTQQVLIHHLPLIYNYKWKPSAHYCWDIYREKIGTKFNNVSQQLFCFKLLFECILLSCHVRVSEWIHTL